MEISSFRSSAELGMDDALFFHQWPVNSLEGLTSESIASLLCEAELSQAEANRPLKQLKTTTWDSCKPENMLNSPSSSSFHLLNSNFAKSLKPKEEGWSYSNILNLPSEFPVSQSSFGNQNSTLRPCQAPARLSTNTRLAQANDHILSERKRREKISQRFIALSALVPGLKKMDKASVLGDAIKYMKQLQEKVKILEEQSKKKSMESLVFVQKHKLYADSENSNPSSAGQSPVITEQLPRIETRICDKDVLIIIHCEKRKGLLEKAVAEIEKLHLSVVNSCVMTFGDSTLNITIIAQKDEEFTMNMKELVKNLRDALEIFM